MGTLRAGGPSYLGQVFVHTGSSEPLHTTVSGWTVSAQTDTARPPRERVLMDSARAALLYVSNRAEDAPIADYACEIAAKRRTDSSYAARSAGVMEFRKIPYRRGP